MITTRTARRVWVCSHADLQHFGCAVVTAGFVAKRHGVSRRVGRLAVDDYLGASRPWSHIFGKPRVTAGATASPEALVEELGSTLRTWFTPDHVIEVQQLDVTGFELGQPEGDGHVGELPPWLTAGRRGAREVGGGYQPRVALVLDLER